jgi:hypothetical protein
VLSSSVLVGCLLCVEYWFPLACCADILVIVLLVGLLFSVGCLSLLVSTSAVYCIRIVVLSAFINISLTIHTTGCKILRYSTDIDWCD